MIFGRGRYDVTLTVASIAAVFNALAAATYAAARIEPSPVIQLFFAYGPLYAVILWLRRDAHLTGVGAVQDLGYFLLLAWPVVIPWYAFRTRGRAGWRLTTGLLGLIFAAHITWFVAAYAIWRLGA